VVLSCAVAEGSAGGLVRSYAGAGGARLVGWATELWYGAVLVVLGTDVCWCWGSVGGLGWLAVVLGLGVQVPLQF